MNTIKLNLTKTLNSYNLFIGYFIFYFLILFLVTLNKGSWGDENHFFATIQRFVNSPLIPTLYDYDEMSTPLPFMLYAAWGKLFGVNLFSLRLLSMLIAFLTYVSIFNLFLQIFSKIKSLLFTVFISLNPYFIGLSVFVFTDMLAIFFTTLFLHAIHKRNFFLLAISIAGGLLCRQYFVFLPIAAGLFFIIEYFLFYKNDSLFALIYIFFGCLPLLLLVSYWHGLTPNNAVKADYIGQALIFHQSALSLYIALIGIYCLPIVLLNFKKIYFNSKVWIPAILGSFFIIIFPIKQPINWIERQHHAVGFFHKMIVMTGFPILEKVIFYLCFLFSLPILFYFFKKIIIKIKTKKIDVFLICLLTTFSFLLVMPLSYMLWEKYFVPLLVFIIIGLETEKVTHLQ